MSEHKGQEPAKPGWQVLRHLWRVRIVAICSQMEMSPSDFAKRYKVPLRSVLNHFRMLENARWLRRVRSRRQGFEKTFYVATRQALVDDEEFARMALDERKSFSEAVIRDLFVRIWQALRAGTLDRRTNSHLSWMPLDLDEQGWDDLMSEEARWFERAREIEAESNARRKETGEPRIPTTVALAGFESPASRN